MKRGTASQPERACPVFNSGKTMDKNITALHTLVKSIYKLRYSEFIRSDLV
jgi:hypothetical protein